MISFITWSVVVGAFVYLICIPFGCSRNVDWIKERAKPRWEELGYEITGYEGYQWSPSGGAVYYQLKRKDTPKVIYSGSLTRWGDEIFVWGPTALTTLRVLHDDSN